MVGHVRRAEGQNRTVDTRFFRPVLYQLSYLGVRNSASSRAAKDTEATGCGRFEVIGALADSNRELIPAGYGTYVIDTL